MSSKPIPACLTAAMLMELSMEFAFDNGNMELSPGAHKIASLASALHRLAKGCQRASEAECNGETYDGEFQFWSVTVSAAEAWRRCDESVTKLCARIDKQVAELSQELAPFGITAKRNGDPRGFALKLYGDKLPSNGMEANVWGVA